MREKLGILLLSNLFLVALAIGIYAIGYEYDRANNLSMEPFQYTYDASIMVYGKRWERLSKGLIYAGLFVDFIIVTIWMRRKRTEIVDIFDLDGIGQ